MKAKGHMCIGLTRNHSSEMFDLRDSLLPVPSDETVKIQEGHLMLGHISCNLIENAIFKDAE